MTTTVLIDDEPLGRGIIREFLEDYPQFRIAQECGDGFEGFKAVMQHRPQLIFLDIQMPKISGFEMLELIEYPPAIIFVTAFDEYALKAFEMHAIDYLLKPFSRERFAKAIARFLENAPDRSTPPIPLLDSASASPQQRGRIVVKTAGKIKIIPVSEIHFLEAADDYVKIHNHEGSFLKNRTMARFEQTLDPGQFVRSHRSYIVNVHEIVRIEPYEKENFLAILKSGRQIPVSRSGYSRLRQVLGI